MQPGLLCFLSTLGCPMVGEGQGDIAWKHKVRSVRLARTEVAVYAYLSCDLLTRRSPIAWRLQQLLCLGAIALREHIGASKC